MGPSTDKKTSPLWFGFAKSQRGSFFREGLSRPVWRGTLSWTLGLSQKDFPARHPLLKSARGYAPCPENPFPAAGGDFRAFGRPQAGRMPFPGADRHRRNGLPGLLRQPQRGRDAPPNTLSGIASGTGGLRSWDSGCQPFYFPTAMIQSRIVNPVVQAAGPALPELDGIRPQ
ncbi:MAG: hypothetical protein RI973_1382 [Bacteroidota bacterium]